MYHATPWAAEETDGQFALAWRDSRSELAEGLEKPQAAVSPKYFYDRQGSKIFEAICALDEYYPTRTEFAIFEAHGAAIAASTGQGAALIDLGAGNCAKAAALLAHLRPGCYVPVDISAAFLRQAVAPLRQLYPDLPMHPVELDFSAGVSLPPTVQAMPRKLFFYPGSSLGNFAPLQALRFLRGLRALGGDLLLGLDLVKEVAVMEAAYDDALGITAAFNLNLLRHVNRVLGADFHLADWAHHVFFNAAQSRMEMHLRARGTCRVSWAGGGRVFEEGETIHTENCYKFTREGALAMLARAGFADAACWTDPAHKFLVCHARAC